MPDFMSLKARKSYKHTCYSEDFTELLEMVYEILSLYGNETFLTMKTKACQWDLYGVSSSSFARDSRKSTLSVTVTEKK
jgi:hypothetical protein